MRPKVFAAVIFALVLFCLANAAVPRKIHYQGVVLNDDSTPLTGTHDVQFWLYETATGGTAVWSETHTDVHFSEDGHFDVMLGESTPLNLPFDRPYYLEMAIDGELLSPRIEMGAAAYSLSSVNQINGVLPDEEGNISIVAGDNVTVTSVPDSNLIRISATGGGGSGALNTINDVSPNDEGNIQLIGAGGIHITPYPDTNLVEIGLGRIQYLLCDSALAGKITADSLKAKKTKSDTVEVKKIRADDGDTIEISVGGGKMVLIRRYDMETGEIVYTVEDDEVSMGLSPDSTLDSMGIRLSSGNSGNLVSVLGPSGYEDNTAWLGFTDYDSMGRASVVGQISTIPATGDAAGILGVVGDIPDSFFARALARTAGVSTVALPSAGVKGVFNESTSLGGVGVLGYSSAQDGKGVYGIAESPTEGVGVRADATGNGPIGFYGYVYDTIYTVDEYNPVGMDLTVQGGRAVGVSVLATDDSPSSLTKEATGIYAEVSAPKKAFGGKFVLSGSNSDASHDSLTSGILIQAKDSKYMFSGLRLLTSESANVLYGIYMNLTGTAVACSVETLGYHSSSAGIKMKLQNVVDAIWIETDGKRGIEMNFDSVATVEGQPSYAIFSYGGGFVFNLNPYAEASNWPTFEYSSLIGDHLHGEMDLRKSVFRIHPYDDAYGDPITTFGGPENRVAIQKVNGSATATLGDNDFTIQGVAPIVVTTQEHGVTISCPDCGGGGGGGGCTGCEVIVAGGSGVGDGIVRTETSDGTVVNKMNANPGTGEAAMEVVSDNGLGIFSPTTGTFDYWLDHIGGSISQPFDIFNNLWVDGDFSASGTKSFVVPHPTKQDTFIRYFCTESPEVMIEYRGTVRLSGGYAEYELPEEFVLMAEPGTYSVSVTPQTLDDPGRTGAVVEGGVVKIRNYGGPADMKVAFVVYATRTGYRDYPVLIPTPDAIKRYQMRLKMIEERKNSD